eukprot:scaffold215084_cov47-Attheya_sp.AAC.1
MGMIARETRERKKTTPFFAGDKRTERCDYFHPVRDSENDEDNDDNSGDDEDSLIEFEYKDEFADESDNNKNSDNGVQDDSE